MRRFLTLLIAALILVLLLVCGWPALERFLSPGTPVIPTELPTTSSSPANDFCPGNALVNGGFEEGSQGWTYSGSQHGAAIPELPLLTETGKVHSGKAAAFLGGYENASDQLAQTFLVPQGAQINLWWTYFSHDPIKDRDTMLGRLVLPDNEDGLPLFYAGGDAAQETWHQTMLDLSQYAGQRLTLEFSTYNDNYYFSWMAIDDICIQAAP